MQTLQKMRTAKPGDQVEVPVYDFVTHSRTTEVRTVNVGDVVVVEGIMVFYPKELREMMNMKIFVDTDDDVRLARRIQRDVAHRGRTLESVLEQYSKFVKPSFEEFIIPTKKYADVIIPFQKQNPVGVELIVRHIQSKLRTPDLSKLYTNLYLTPPSAQCRALHTLIRDRNTSREDFIFYSDRLLRLLVEDALGHLPFTEKVVVTPTGEKYVGVATLSPDEMVGVSIIRAGESMEAALRAIIKNVSIGKLLIERAAPAAAPTLTYTKLPNDISKRWVLLMDPVINTGSSIIVAIEKLLKVGVQMDRIVLVSLMASPQGVHNVCKQYPHIKMILSEIETGVHNHLVLPGIGDFADRYFGTRSMTFDPK